MTARGLTAARTQETVLAAPQFDRIARIAHREAGLTIPVVKMPMVQARLARRLRVLGLGGFASYLDFVESPRGAHERRELVSALTTNVTQFFREQHHFDALRTKVLPPLVARARAGGRVRIWSAGCSTGQEPYSIAIEVLRLAPDAPGLDIRILATDIDPHVLAVARAARYPAAGLAGLAPATVTAVVAGAHSADGSVTLRDEVRAMVTFRELNLLGRWPMRGLFDAIFCRNVVIYFDAATQAGLWPRFEAALAPGGWLFLGHSERLPDRAAPGLTGAGITSYRRSPPPPAKEL